MENQADRKKKDRMETIAAKKTKNGSLKTKGIDEKIRTKTE